MELQKKSWQSLPIEVQKEEYEKQLVAYEFVRIIKQWATHYAHLARAFVDEFGEDEVLDILEKTWWDLQYEGGLTFRQDFEKNPRQAMQEMVTNWHNGMYQELGAGTYDEPFFEEERWDLVCLQCYHQVFVELNERKIGISWCMSDLAAVRGWSPKVIMRFPNVMLRGAPYCHQVRMIVERADPDEDIWTKEKSEEYGWRSIKKIEEG